MLVNASNEAIIKDISIFSKTDPLKKEHNNTNNTNTAIANVTSHDTFTVVTMVIEIKFAKIESNRTTILLYFNLISKY
jgi:hypothetical protein